MKQVILNSFHSATLSLVCMDPRAIISFDSHLDIFTGTRKFIHELFDLPFPLRAAFLRTNVHSLLRSGLPNVPLYLVISFSAFRVESIQRSRDIESLSNKEMTFEEFEHLTKQFLEETRIKLFLSPPKNLKYLFEKVDKHTTVVDIDVDYLEEFQSVCYTKAPQFKDEPERRHLGNMEDIFRTINKIHPQMVLISEAKLDQIKSLKQPLGRLIDFLKNQGYTIEMGEIVSSDEAAFEALRKAEAFHNEFLVSARRRILQNQENLDSIENEICSALRQLAINYES